MLTAFEAAVVCGEHYRSETGAQPLFTGVKHMAAEWLVLSVPNVPQL